MTTLSKKKLLDELKDKESREAFVEEHVTTGLPFQIHGLREKLGLSQSELARRAGMAQERISVLEDPNYEFIPKINTLLKLASVFDVPLIVKFGTWRELFEWETELSPEQLSPPTFNEELDGLERAASLSNMMMNVGTIPLGTIVIGDTRNALFRFIPIRYHPVPVKIINSLDVLVPTHVQVVQSMEQVPEIFEEFAEISIPSSTLIDHTGALPF